LTIAKICYETHEAAESNFQPQGPVMSLIFIVLGAIAAVVVPVIGVWFVLSRIKRKSLLRKYGDPQIADKILKGEIWQGMTEAQLIDSWGRPEAREQNVLKTKTTATFKYGMTGKNRFADRVMLENGVVVGWTQRPPAK
jgi:hypothetical protein